MNVTATEHGGFSEPISTVRVQVGEQERPITLKCPNCGQEVIVKADDNRAHCTRCSVVWDPTKALIRGQR